MGRKSHFANLLGTKSVIESRSRFRFLTKGNNRQMTIEEFESLSRLKLFFERFTGISSWEIVYTTRKPQPHYSAEHSSINFDCKQLLLGLRELEVLVIIFATVVCNCEFVHTPIKHVELRGFKELISDC